MIGMTYFLKLTAFVAATAFVVEGQSETHTVTFQNLWAILHSFVMTCSCLPPFLGAVRV